MGHIDYGQEITEKRLHTLLSRIRDRVKRPCTGRFDSSFDLESEFIDDCSNAIYVAELLAKSPPSGDDLDSYYFSALADEVEDSERLVRSKWLAQDAGIAFSRATGNAETKSSPEASKLHPNQTLL